MWSWARWRVGIVRRYVNYTWFAWVFCGARCLCAGSARAKAAPGRAASLHFDGRTACRLPCGARFQGPSRNSLRSLRSLRSDNRDENVHEVRCAHGLESCAPRRRRGAPQPTRAQLCGKVVGIGGSENQPHLIVAAGGTGWVRFLWWRGAEQQGRRAQRASLSFLSRLSERRERSEQSEFRDATRVRAPQRSRHEVRPPKYEPPPGTACRDASTSERSNYPKRTATRNVNGLRVNTCQACRSMT